MESPILSTDDLALILGGSYDSYTGDVMRLIAKADIQKRYVLRRSLPREVCAYEIWQNLSKPTGYDVLRALEEILTPFIKYKLTNVDLRSILASLGFQLMTIDERVTRLIDAEVET